MKVKKENRLLVLESIHLEKGGHSPNGGYCVMEAVNWVKGNPWSDQGVSRVISVFMRSWNDQLNSVDRDRLLKPLIPKLAEITQTSDVIESRRSCMSLDWLIREFTPEWLEQIGLESDLRSCTEIKAMLEAAGEKVRKIHGEKVEHIERYTWTDAVWYSAKESTRDAAGDAAWFAAGEEGHLIRNLAIDASRAAATLIVRDKTKLRSTVEKLQLSAVGLVERMIAAKE